MRSYRWGRALAVCLGLVLNSGGRVIAQPVVASDAVSLGIDESTGSARVYFDESDVKLQIGMLLQYRYTLSAAPDAPDPIDATEYGFAFRRLRPRFDLRAVDDKLRLFLQLETARNSSRLLDGWVSFQPNKQVRVRVGRFHLRFNRELAVAAPYLLSVDRSALSNTLNTDAANRVEGLEVQLTGKTQRVFFSFNEGLGVSDTAFGDARSDWGLTNRYERLLIGENFKQFSQFTAPYGTAEGLMFGAAWHVQHLNDLGSRTAATTDLSYQNDGFNAMLIGSMQIAEDRNNAIIGEPEHQFGVVFKSGVYLNEKLEPFIRGEWGTTSGDHPDLQLITLGMNYYFFGQAMKFSADATVAFDGVGPAFDRSVDGLLRTPPGSDRFVFHAQLQMMF